MLSRRNGPFQLFGFPNDLSNKAHPHSFLSTHHIFTVCDWGTLCGSPFLERNIGSSKIWKSHFHPYSTKLDYLVSKPNWTCQEGYINLRHDLSFLHVIGLFFGHIWKIYKKNWKIIFFLTLYVPWQKFYNSSYAHITHNKMYTFL